MATKTKVQNVQVLESVSDIVTSVLNEMGLSSIPSNGDTGAKGKYSAWSKDQQTYNENVVRPFRANVARVLKTVMDKAITDGEHETVYRLMVDGLTYIEKQPDTFYKAVKDTAPANISDDTLVAVLAKRLNIPEDTARAMLKK
jgi:hypothetical protein